MKEELNMTKADKSPIAMGAMTFVSFVLVGFVPLISYVWDYSSDSGSQHLFEVSILLTFLAFIGIGWLKSYVAQTAWFRSIMETLFLGGAAAVLSYYVGSFLKSLV